MLQPLLRSPPPRAGTPHRRQRSGGGSMLLEVLAVASVLSGVTFLIGHQLMGHGDRLHAHLSPEQQLSQGWGVHDEAGPHSAGGGSHGSGSSSTSSSAVRRRWASKGFVGPFPLAAKAWWVQGGEFERLIAQFQERDRGRTRRGGKRHGLPPDAAAYYRQMNEPPYVKGYWRDIPAMLSLAQSPDILAVLNDTIGPDVMFWGAIALERPVGGTHNWHSEVETVLCNESATVWVAAKGVAPDSTIQLISHSMHAADTPLLGPAHMYNATCTRPNVTADPQAHAACIADARARFAQEGRRLAARVQERTGRASAVVSFAMTDGDFVVFQGQTWHGAAAALHRPRWAVVLHYAAPSCLIRQPFDFNVPAAAAGIPQAMPLAHMVLGSASPRQQALNFVVDARLPMLGGVYEKRLQDHLAQGFLHADVRPLGRHNALFPWASSPRDVKVLDHVAAPGVTQQFLMPRSPEVSTELLEVLWLSVTTHLEAVPPHPLEQHEATEELVFVLNGTLGVVRSGALSRHPVKWSVPPSTLVYHPGSEAHTLVCMDPAGCTVLLVKWRPWARPPGMFTPSQGLATLPGSLWQPLLAQGRYTLLERAVLECGLLLHLHVDDYKPHQALPAHTDAYDVLLIVASGTVLVGPEHRTLGAGDAAVKPAGSLMSLRAGPRGCKLIVAELHARLLPPDLAGLAATTMGASQLLQLQPPPGVQPCRTPAHVPGAAVKVPPPLLQYQGTWMAGSRGSSKVLPRAVMLELEQEHSGRRGSVVPGLTIATHADLSRLPVIRQMCRSFRGPVSVALLAPTFHGALVTEKSRLSRHDGLADHSTAPALPDDALVPHDGSDLWSLVANMPVLMKALTRDAGCRLTVQVYAVALAAPEERFVSYPYNALRNAALAAVSTELVSMLDADALPSNVLSRWHNEPDSYASLLRLLQQPPPAAGSVCAAAADKGGAHAGGHTLQQQRRRLQQTHAQQQAVALVLPVFELGCSGRADSGADRAACVHAATMFATGSKADVVRGFESRALQLFRVRCLLSYNGTNHARWLETNKPYAVPWTWPYEPYTIMRTEQVLWYSEAYAGYFHDKSSYAMRLALLGARLVVVPDAWLVHWPHQETNLHNKQDARLAATMGAILKQAKAQTADMVARTAAWHASAHPAERPAQLEVLSRYTCAHEGRHNLGPLLNAGSVARHYHRCPAGLAAAATRLTPCRN